MQKTVFPAKLESLPSMIEFIREGVRKKDPAGKSFSQIRLAAEEILVNVINYAYPGTEGSIEITYDLDKNKSLTIEITDSGTPFNPLQKEDPDISLPVEEREIGGLGIFMVRKVMDEVTYLRKNNHNILKMVKR